MKPLKECRGCDNTNKDDIIYPCKCTEGYHSQCFKTYIVDKRIIECNACKRSYVSLNFAKFKIASINLLLCILFAIYLIFHHLLNAFLIVGFTYDIYDGKLNNISVIGIIGASIPVIIYLFLSLFSFAPDKDFPHIFKVFAQGVYTLIAIIAQGTGIGVIYIFEHKIYFNIASFGIGIASWAVCSFSLLLVGAILFVLGGAAYNCFLKVRSSCVNNCCAYEV
jgi:hypothetical protein